MGCFDGCVCDAYVVFDEGFEKPRSRGETSTAHAKSGRRCFRISGLLERHSCMREVNPSRARRCISESLRVTECSRFAARSSVVRNLR